MITAQSIGRRLGERLARKRQDRYRRRTRLWIEQLEPRCVPTLTTLASFDGSNGGGPYGGLIEDSSGNLFGTTGGSATVFEVQAGSGT
jgi:hypothetical protein